MSLTTVFRKGNPTEVRPDDHDHGLTLDRSESGDWVLYRNGEIFHEFHTSDLHVCIEDMLDRLEGQEVNISVLFPAKD